MTMTQLPNTDENPYRAPPGPAEPKSPGQRLPVRAWLLVAFLVAWAIIFGVLSAVCFSYSVGDMARYGGGGAPALGSIATDMGLAIAQLALSAYAVRCAKQSVREARQAVEKVPQNPPGP